MLDQSYYTKTDEIIEHYGPKAAFSDPDHAGHPGGVSLSAGEASELCSR